MCGDEVLPLASKMPVDIAFERAWKRWPHRRMFPSIRLGRKPSVNTISQMTHASYRRHLWYLYWNCTVGERRVEARHEASPFDVDFDLVAQAFLDELTGGKEGR